MTDHSGNVRVHKFMADCGIASRRKCEDMVKQGIVKINGRTASVGDTVDPASDRVTVLGKKISAQQKSVYIMLNKPRGFVTTMSDSHAKRCVAELVQDVDARVYPVGRLDMQSEGLLLLTNDGDFANALTHPTKHIPKYYRVTVRPDITDEQLAAFSNGIMLDGRMTAPAEIRVIDKFDDRCVVEIVLYEGRNRQIRRMLQSLNIDVARLKRTAVGPVKLGMLQPGAWRYLTDNEVIKLLNASERNKTDD